MLHILQPGITGRCAWAMLHLLWGAAVAVAASGWAEAATAAAQHQRTLLANIGAQGVYAQDSALLVQKR